ncbi:MAG: FCD domain-containing protein, partial [Acidobacteriota bacterium]
FEYIEVREVLEPKALDLARHRLDPDDLRDMLALNQPGPNGELRVDNRLHHYWIEHSGNRYIQDFFRLHGPFYETLFDRATLAEYSVSANAEQHCAILGHLLDRDWDRAKAALQDHIRRQQPKVVKLIASYKASVAGEL